MALYVNRLVVFAALLLALGPAQGLAPRNARALAQAAAAAAPLPAQQGNGNDAVTALSSLLANGLQASDIRGVGHA